MDAFAFDLHELLAVRVAQVRALSQDAALTPESDHEPKRQELARMMESLRGWAEPSAALENSAPLFAAVTDRDRVFAADEILKSHRVDEKRGRLVLLEVLTSTAWPSGVRWRIPREQACTEAVAALSPSLGLDDGEALSRAHKKAYSRLSRASVPVGAKLTLAAGGLALSAFSAGTLAPALGTAVGGAMGLSGAAATSAGLAFLGGGSLASGGFGMAGGVMLVHAAAGAGYNGAKFVATSLARQSQRAFLNELAKLHVAARVLEDAAIVEGVLNALIAIEEDLAEQRFDARGDALRSRDAWLSNWRSLGLARKALEGEREAERVAAARRAVKGEIRYLRGRKSESGEK